MRATCQQRRVRSILPTPTHSDHCPRQARDSKKNRVKPRTIIFHRIGPEENATTLAAVLNELEAAGTDRSFANRNVVTHLAMRDKSMSHNDFKPLVNDIERAIHHRPSRMRYAMNAAPISIGSRSLAWKQKAIGAARRIAKVEIDHGKTGCKTPNAIPHIQRNWARRNK